MSDSVDLETILKEANDDDSDIDLEDMHSDNAEYTGSDSHDLFFKLCVFP